MFKDAKNSWITVGLIYELANYNTIRVQVGHHTAQLAGMQEALK